MQSRVSWTRPFVRIIYCRATCSIEGLWSWPYALGLSWRISFMSSADSLRYLIIHPPFSRIIPILNWSIDFRSVSCFDVYVTIRRPRRDHHDVITGTTKHRFGCYSSKGVVLFYRPRRKWMFQRQICRWIYILFCLFLAWSERRLIYTYITAQDVDNLALQKYQCRTVQSFVVFFHMATVALGLSRDRSTAGRRSAQL